MSLISLTLAESEQDISFCINLSVCLSTEISIYLSIRRSLQATVHSTLSVRTIMPPHLRTTTLSTSGGDDARRKGARQSLRFILDRKDAVYERSFLDPRQKCSNTSLPCDSGPPSFYHGPRTDRRGLENGHKGTCRPVDASVRRLCRVN